MIAENALEYPAGRTRPPVDDGVSECVEPEAD